MDYQLVLVCSALVLFLWIGNAEGRMPWRGYMGRRPKDWVDKEWSASERKAYRKKEYRTIFIVWAVFTIGVAIYDVFFR